jgi:hypothetical protein
MGRSLKQLLSAGPEPSTIPRVKPGRKNPTAYAHRVRVPASVQWCTAALLGSTEEEVAAGRVSPRMVAMVGSRFGRPFQAAKRVELVGSTIRTSNASEGLPSFEERIRLSPAGPEGTEVVWSGRIDPGSTLDERLEVRWARRLLTRDAERCLNGLTHRATGHHAVQPFSKTAT